MTEQNWKPETIAVHGGYSPEPTTKAVAVPIYQTTSYVFEDVQHAADLFALGSELATPPATIIASVTADGSYDKVKIYDICDFIAGQRFHPEREERPRASSESRRLAARIAATAWCTASTSARSRASWYASAHASLASCRLLAWGKYTRSTTCGTKQETGFSCVTHSRANFTKASGVSIRRLACPSYSVPVPRRRLHA